VVRNTLTLLTPHTGSLLADQQNKQSGSYQQGKQNTDDERNNPVPTGLNLFRSSAFLRRSETQPEEKITHRPIPRDEVLAFQGVCQTCRLLAKTVPGPTVKEERLPALHLVNKRRLFASHAASFRSSA
jgi:hypothetical protein